MIILIGGFRELSFFTSGGWWRKVGEESGGGKWGITWTDHKKIFLIKEGTAKIEQNAIKNQFRLYSFSTV